GRCRQRAVAGAHQQLTLPECEPNALCRRGPRSGEGNEGKGRTRHGSLKVSGVGRASQAAGVLAGRRWGSKGATLATDGPPLRQGQGGDARGFVEQLDAAPHEALGRGSALNARARQDDRAEHAVLFVRRLSLERERDDHVAGERIRDRLSMLAWYCSG